MALLLAFQMTGASQTPGNSTSESTSVNPAANMSLASASLANASMTNANPANASAISLQLEGIWSFSLKGTETITAVLHQQGEVVTGSAKSEGEKPWNAVLQGTLSAGRLDLNMIYLRNSSLVTLQLAGAAEDENVLGTFVQVDDQGGFEVGSFSGNKINADLSAYVPARLPAAEKNASAADETDATAKTGATVPDTTAPDTTTKPVSLGNPKYQDVHSLAGTVPESLGVGFVGDGTAGSGGMGLG